MRPISISRMKTNLILLTVFLTTGLPCQSSKAADEDSRRAEEISFFETKIRPVLETSCKSCHGPKIAESELRLDSASALKQGGALHGPAVVPGKPDESPLFQAINYKTEDLKMPPKPGPLKPEVVADFRRWIEHGAVWPEDGSKSETTKRFDLATRKANLPWLWSKPLKPGVPKLNSNDSVRNEIDSFLLAELEKNHIRPAPDTDELAWLRRASIVLTGLPPTVSEIESFQKDQSPDRRSAVIDRLLASPAYGERQTRHWMDLVRYAESRGHEGDYNIANAWRYRDYLIQAFNDDVPYDQFVREHLAGDLLEQPRYDPKSGANLSLPGTGWAFLGEEVHSPVDIRQDETDRLDNKIDVLGKTFLGLTIACARCHDHKFDAISQKDYYALAGFFQGSTYRQAPFATMKADAQIGTLLDQVRDRKSKEIAELIASINAPSAKELQAKAEADEKSAMNQVIDLLVKTALSQPQHVLAHWAGLFTIKSPDDRKKQAEKWLETKPGVPQTESHREILNFSHDSAGWAVDGRAFGNGPMPCGAILPPVGADKSSFHVLKQNAAVVDRHFATPRKDDQTEGEAGNLGGWLRGSGTGRTHKFTVQTGHIQYRLKGKIRIFACVASHYMLAGPLHGVLSREIEVKGDEPGWVHQNLTEYIGQRVVIEVTPSPNAAGQLLEIVETASPAAPAASSTLSESDLELIKTITGNPDDFTLYLWLANRLDKAKKAFTRHQPINTEEAAWMSIVGEFPALFEGLEQKLRPILSQWYEEETALASQIIPKSPLAPALVDLNPVDENVLLRGSWRRPGSLAPRALPDAFESDLSLSNSGSGRLELAQRLTQPDQPLLARVWVNRLWQQVFGRGIVPTPDNFGILGQRPTHPDLLDWLAVSFTNTDKWSTKAALKRMLLSRAFAMSSRSSDKSAELADPENRLLHRANLIRVDAEVIRDSMLAISGRLDRKLYGPGIPVHLTEFIVGRGRPGESGPLDGAGRRSIYTTVRRNFLPTFLLAFDLPTPFTTVGRRNITNVPAQSLALANDPFVIEQARFWADRELREHPDTADQERIARMFLSALARPPRQEELKTMEMALAAFKETRSSDSKNTDKAKISEAWADLGHLLFSLNEFRYLP